MGNEVERTAFVRLALSRGGSGNGRFVLVLTAGRLLASSIRHGAHVGLSTTCNCVLAIICHVPRLWKVSCK